MLLAHMLVAHRRQMGGYATNPDFSRLSVVELKYPSEGNSIVRGGQLTDFPGVRGGKSSTAYFHKGKAILKGRLFRSPTTRN